jgi:protein-S-isoprenylcysteine O-methyltransferase Ste14
MNSSMTLKIRHAINLHKALTALVVVTLMLLYQNFSLGPWIYLALHGNYGLMWLVKDSLYPDRQFEQELPLSASVTTFLLLMLYWVPPFLLIRSGMIPPLPIVAIAVSLNLWGIFLHYASDAQKYFTLKYQPGLISEGLFARCRNPNYLGEILIYFSFALLSLHWQSFLILAGFVAGIFVPNMLKKDQSLSRYPGFAAYKARSGLIIPKLLPLRPSETTTSQESASSNP